MKYLSVFILLFLLVSGCSDNPAGSGNGFITVESFDAPAPEGIEHLYLHVIEVSAHHSDNGWIVLSESDTVVDYMELVNGVTVLLADSVSLPVGDYEQMRLLLSDSNEIVIQGNTYNLTTPSAQQTGVKLNLNFTVDENQLIEIYVDFDIAKSIVSASSKYLLHPTFKAFKQVISGTIAGKVVDSLNNPLENVMIDATSTEYSTSTLTDTDGNYLLVLPADIYNITATADSLTADTSYSGIELNPLDNLTDFDFKME